MEKLLKFRGKSSQEDLFYFAVIPALFFQVIATYLYLKVYNGQPIGQVIYTINKAVLILWPLLWVFFARVQGWTFFKGKIGKSLFWGLISGLGIVALVIGLFLLFRDYWEQFLPNLLTAIKSFSFLENNYLLFAFFLSLVHSFIEEYFWRWFIVNGLMIKFGKWTAIIIGSLAFALHHAIVVSLLLPPVLILISSLAIFGIGIMWSTIYLKTKSLYGAWMSHFFADAVVMGVGYFMIYF